MSTSAIWLRGPCLAAVIVTFTPMAVALSSSRPWGTKLDVQWVDFIGGVLAGSAAAEVTHFVLSRRASKRRDGYARADDALAIVHELTKRLSDYFGVLRNDDFLAWLHDKTTDLRRHLLLVPDRQVRGEAFDVLRLLDAADEIADFAKGVNPIHLHETEVWLRVLTRIGDVLSAYRRGDRIPGRSPHLVQVETVWLAYQARGESDAALGSAPGHRQAK